MRKVFRLKVVLAVAVFLSGCQQYPATLTASGPDQDLTDGSSQINEFRGAYERAYSTRNRMVGGVMMPPALTGANAVSANVDYLDAGLTLVNTNCKDYFRRAGHLQQNANIIKTLSNAFLPIASGAVAIGGSNARAAAIIALLGAANNGALNAVYHDFLFDSSNIDDVGILVTKALSAHEAGVRANMALPGTTVTFDWVTDQIIEHRVQCEPARVLSLARKAINAAIVAVTNEGGSGASTTGGAKTALTGTAAPGAVGNPPPPASVSVDVVRSSPPPSPTTTVIAAPDTSSFDLLKCLYPGATHLSATGVGLNAAGRRVPIDIATVTALDAWLKQNRYLSGPATLLVDQNGVSLRTGAVDKFCK